MDKKIFLEINEFTKEFLLDNDIKEYKYLSEIFKDISIFGNRIDTISEGRSEGIDLDPWVEWVTIHSGKKPIDHKITSLGSAKIVKYPMIWEEWEKKGISYSLCGVFNSFLRKNKFCNLFIPDPWSRSSAKPAILNIFISGTSYLAKSYTGINILIKLTLALYSIFTFLPIIIFRFKIILKAFIKYFDFNFSLSICYIIYEYLISFFGLYFSKKYNSERIILCSNLVAHAQHHFWKVKGKKSSCALALFLANDLIENTYKFFSKTHKIYILNGLSQKNVINLNQFDYLPRNGHISFLKSLNIKYEKLLEGMTHDAKLIFKSKNDKEKAFKKLKSLTINNEPIFSINSKNKNSIEYYLNFRKKVSRNTKVLLGKEILNFSDFFYNIGIRTGSHDPKGFIIVPHEMSNSKITSQIFTHKLFSYFK